jgi:hypothetical protein
VLSLGFLPQQNRAEIKDKLVSKMKQNFSFSPAPSRAQLYHITRPYLVLGFMDPEIKSGYIRHQFYTNTQKVSTKLQ